MGVEGVCGVWERVVKEHGEIKGLSDCVLPLQVTSRVVKVVSEVGKELRELGLGGYREGSGSSLDCSSWFLASFVASIALPSSPVLSPCGSTCKRKPGA